MIWITRTTLALEEREWTALHAAALEEDARLALWRMDAALAPLFAAENARAYGDFLDAEEAEPAAVVAARFSLMAGDEVEMEPEPEAEDPPWLAMLKGETEAFPPPPPLAAPGNQREAANRQDPSTQQAFNMAEFAQRQQLAFQSQVPVVIEDTTLTLSPFQARWMGGDLVLTRRVEDAYGIEIQGLWLDRPALFAWLLSESQSVLPGAHLEPVPETAITDPGRQLALLPLRL